MEQKAEAEIQKLNFTVDSYNNGIAFGQHRSKAISDPRETYALQLCEEMGQARLRSRYRLHPRNPLQELERHLLKLSRRGVLRNSVIYFGSSTDPFHPFEGKFDASMRFLELFKKYVPGLLVIQTRSPLLVIALPVLTHLGKHVSVTYGLETCLDSAIERYTPGLPRVEDRLKAVRTLKRFGVEVNIQVSPVLPYGDWRQDAQKFAEIICENADHVYVQALSDGTEGVERRIRHSKLAKKLAEDRKFHWLRSDAANPLISKLEVLAPNKLKTPMRYHLLERQMKIFAA